jgi:hypothetical protein
VPVTDRLSHVPIIDAATAGEAEALARELWAENAEHELFEFSEAVGRIILGKKAKSHLASLLRTPPILHKVAFIDAVARLRQRFHD